MAFYKRIDGGPPFSLGNLARTNTSGINSCVVAHWETDVPPFVMDRVYASEIYVSFLHPVVNLVALGVCHPLPNMARHAGNTW